MPLAIGLGFVAVALVTYSVSHPVRYYNHFVWQALAFLEGRVAIEFPVADSVAGAGNAGFQDVLAILNPDGSFSGRGLIPFPPLPAIVLLPFVAVWGLRTDEQLISALLGAVDVGIAWWMLGRLGVRLGARFWTTVFFAFGTVFWYSAQLGTTWYFAHVVAVGLLLAAVGVAVGRDPASVGVDEDERAEPPVDDAHRASTSAVRAALGGAFGRLDRPQLLAGLLFGLAATARVSVLFGAPFFAFVGSGGTWQRRAVSAGIGAALPVAILLAYNLATTGHLVHPGYELLYRQEAVGYPTLNYHPGWGIEDPRYLPQNFQIAWLSPPAILPTELPTALGDPTPLCTEPGATRGLFDANCPIAMPRDTGMSILLSSPAYLLVIPAFRRLYGRSRLVTGAAIAILFVAVFNLMHFSQGWVQVGYRFSNDFVPFALPLVALGAERLRDHPRVVGGLVVASVVVSVWGVVWGNILGW
ncbi:MAG TPA: hypothetical protein VKA85_08945 [Candidatus Limnocylindrales bacterium]|nr:hypothetical protein [Candidatus Limnocylindrales bacterium]